MKTLLLFIAAVALTGCSTFDVKHQSEFRNVNWVVADDVAAECKLRGGSASVLPVLACATWSGHRCTIVTSRETTHEILGHEVRHCFEGAFHD